MAKEKEYPASNLEFLTAHYVNEARSLVCVKWWNHGSFLDGRALRQDFDLLYSSQLSYFENVTMVGRLLRLGANPNPRNPKVFPPLLLALGANDKSLDLTRLLLEYGAEATIYHPEVSSLLSCTSSL